MKVLLNRFRSLTLSCYLPGMGLGRRKSRTFLKPLVSSELLIASVVGRERSVGHTERGKIHCYTEPMLYLPFVPVRTDPRLAGISNSLHLGAAIDPTASQPSFNAGSEPLANPALREGREPDRNTYQKHLLLRIPGLSVYPIHCIWARLSIQPRPNLLLTPGASRSPTLRWEKGGNQIATNTTCAWRSMCHFK